MGASLGCQSAFVSDTSADKFGRPFKAWPTEQLRSGDEKEAKREEKGEVKKEANF